MPDPGRPAPPGHDRGDPHVVVEFEYLKLMIPGGTDLRELAVSFVEMVALCAATGEELGRFDFRGGRPHGVQVLCGLSVAEPEGTWSEGPRTVLQMDLLRAPDAGLDLVIEHFAAPIPADGIPAIVSNGWARQAQVVFRGGRLAVRLGEPAVDGLDGTPAPSPAPGRRALLVLGVHRSGTSAMAAALVLAGAAPPQDLMPPMPDNPDGFWESVAVTELNEAMLRQAGSAWDDVFALRRQTLFAQFAPAWEEAALTVLRDRFVDGDMIVLKDPRVSLLLPFWRRVLHRAGYAADCVIMVRDPREVADSLLRRNGFPRSKGLLLWANAMVAVERDTRGMPRCFVPAADLGRSAEAQLRRVGTALGLPFLRDADLPRRELELLGERQQRRRADAWALGPFQRLMPFHAAMMDGTTPAERLAEAADAVGAWLAELDAVVGPVLREDRVRRVSMSGG